MSEHHATPSGTPDVTNQLAEWIVGLNGADIPAEVRQEGLRTFVNWVGCAVGGARHETVDCALRALMPFSGGKTATILGRPERIDTLHAALINGITSHVLDYDDTHLKNHHPPCRAGRLGVAGAGRSAPGFRRRFF